jgi:hypothetical protein
VPRGVSHDGRGKGPDNSRSNHPIGGSSAAYEALVASLGDECHVKLAYNGATLKIVWPGTAQEFLSKTIAQMVDQRIVE